MSKNERVVTREELFDLVWEKPTRQLAEEFGVSDVALGKICKRMDILKPPRGYWAKIAGARQGMAFTALSTPVELCAFPSRVYT